MVKDGNYTYRGEHRIINVIVESLCCMPETNIILYVKYAAIKNVLNFKN